MALAADFRRAVAAMDPDQPIASLTTLEKMVEDRAGGFTFIARALGVVALIALVLSMLGIYSLMAFLTTQRTQEIGVRMALGAGRWQVIRAIGKRAVGITVAGSILGAALAFGIGQVMQSILFGLVTMNLAPSGRAGAADRRCGVAGGLSAGAPRRADRSDDRFARDLGHRNQNPGHERTDNAIVSAEVAPLAELFRPDLQPRRRQHSSLGARRLHSAAAARIDAGLVALCALEVGDRRRHQRGAPRLAGVGHAVRRSPWRPRCTAWPSACGRSAGSW